MHIHLLVNTFGQDLLHRYGEKIHKLTLHGSFTCPNRDGTLGKGGCTFCNVASFADEGNQQLSIRDQLAARKDEIARARRYLAYFQAYTSTYAEVEYLRKMYEEALQVTDMVGLCVGTRPDCVPDAVLDLLAGYQQQGLEIWLELGLQSAHADTLKRINRGHDYSAYADAVSRAKARNLKICTHLIVGLPGEGKAECFSTLEQVIATGTDGIKLHPLHVVEGSTMAKAWRADRLTTLSQNEYADIAAEMIRHTPPEVVYHRVTATARKPTLLAPEWCERRWGVMLDIYRYLEANGPQGSALGRSFQFPG